MNGLKQQLQGTGLAGALRLSATGQELTLNFAKGESSKKVTLTLGTHVITGRLELRERAVPDGLPDLELVLSLDQPKPVVKQAVVAVVEAPPAVSVAEVIVAPAADSVDVQGVTETEVTEVTDTTGAAVETRRRKRR